MHEFIQKSLTRRDHPNKPIIIRVIAISSSSATIKARPYLLNLRPRAGGRRRFLGVPAAEVVLRSSERLSCLLRCQLVVLLGNDDNGDGHDNGDDNGSDSRRASEPRRVVRQSTW